MMQPSRISSEAPEVVQPPSPPPPGLEHVLLIPTFSERQKQKRIGASRYQKQLDEQETQTRDFEPPPRELYQPFPVELLEEQRRKRRARRILATAALVIMAFLAGGGIGGGVGGSIAARKLSTPTTILPTATVTAPGSNHTTVVDYAGCPSVNNETYTPIGSGVKFVKICTTEIVAREGQKIDMGNTTESTLEACLDTCAAREGCVGATWFIFSAMEPRRNSVCFLKNGTGQATPATGSGQQLASGILQF